MQSMLFNPKNGNKKNTSSQEKMFFSRITGCKQNLTASALLFVAKVLGKNFISNVNGAGRITFSDKPCKNTGT